MKPDNGNIIVKIFSKTNKLIRNYPNQQVVKEFGTWKTMQEVL